MLSSSTYAILKSEILTAVLPPGTPLQEEALAKRLEVSRTPVREALRKLGHEGLVTHLPGRAVLVSEVSHRDLAEVFQIRRLIEPALAALAAGKCDPARLNALSARFARLSKTLPTPESIAAQDVADRELHAEIARAAGNTRLAHIMESLNDVVARGRSVGTPLRYTQSIREHRRVIAALKARDPDKAEQAMRQHIVRACQRILAIA